MAQTTEAFDMSGKSEKKMVPRILIARFNLDGHDRGIFTVINALKVSGMEVIYILFAHPRQIVKAAVQEGVDVIGVTSSQGEHMLVCSTLMEEMRNGEMNIPVILGGVVPSVDIPKLKKIGVKRIFGPGSKPSEAAAYIYQIIKGK
jgi:methylmalonyl-CoA mutase C-terminal domain/subunit